MKCFWRIKVMEGHEGLNMSLVTLCKQLVVELNSLVIDFPITSWENT